MSWPLAIAIVGALLLIAVILAVRVRRFVRTTPILPGVTIDTPTDDTKVSEGGTARSIQTATITLPDGVLGELWTPVMLERLGRTYWAFMSTFSLHILRVFYTDDQRSVSLLIKPFTMLGFGAPKYETADGWGRISWPITHGLLVARQGRGAPSSQLEIEVRKLEDLPNGGMRVHLEVEVTNFYPLFYKISPWLYANTQSRIHVLLAYGFMRRVINRDLEQSVTGRFAED